MCKRLQKVIFLKDSNLISIGKKAFAYSSIENISIPSNLNQIESEAFMFCKIKSIHFNADSKLSSIGDKAFCLSSIENVIVPKKVNLINDQAFYCRKLVSVEILGDVLNICKNNFISDKISIVSLPNVKNISIYFDLFKNASKNFSLFMKCDVKINYTF